MVIRINAGERRIVIPIPLSLLGIMPRASCKALAKQGIQLTPSQMRFMFRELRRTKRRYPDFTLVEVLSNDGEKVRITL